MPTPVPKDGIPPSGWVILGISPTLLFLSTVSVLLWFLSRRIASSIRIDDWVSLASLVFAYGATITSLMTVTVGHGGYHITDYTPSELQLWMKVSS